jgi:hypothetical protein
LQLPIGFRRDRRDVHLAPATTIAGGGVHQLPEQGGGVQPICLRTASPSIDGNTRRIDHDIVDGLCAQRAMQPEGLTTRFVTAPHGRVRWEVESPFRRRDLLNELVHMASGDRPDTRLRFPDDSEGELPARAPQIEREEQHRGDRFGITGYGLHRSSVPLVEAASTLGA